MVRRVAVVVVLVPLAVPIGCDGTSGVELASPDEDAAVTDDAGTDVRPERTYYKSGSRLRAEVVRAGGVALFERFYDTVRDETCRFQKIASGEYRCLPEASSVFYADAACTTPAAASVDSYANNRYAATVTFGGCGEPISITKIYAIGSELASGDVYSKFDTTCESLTLNESPENRALGPEVAFTEFVKATPQMVDVSDDLAIERLVGDDGSEWLSDRVRDLTRDDECTPYALRASDGTPMEACIPEQRAFSSWPTNVWADETCTEPAATYHCGEGVAVVLRREPLDGAGEGCETPDDRATLYAPSDALATVRHGAACEVSDADGKYVAVGARLDETPYPEIALSRLGDSRVRLKAFTKGGHVLTMPPTLFDEAADATCYAEMFTGGKLYCVHSDVTAYRAPTSFKDAACTQPIHLSGRCGRAPRLLVNGEIMGSESTFDTQVYPLGPPLAITTYYENGLGDCSAQALDDRVAHDILAPVDVSTQLAEVVRARE